MSVLVSIVAVIILLATSVVGAVRLARHTRELEDEFKTRSSRGTCRCITPISSRPKANRSSDHDEQDGAA